jgi:alkanesulfonate monooxygenase SsuD/methylene tetrahydromethanopterin reductase-like flavin-dependent oxidoreductase (luciferase family)
MEQIGVKPESPLTSIQEITSNLRALLRGERVTFEGRYVHLRDVELHVAPGSVPPVLLGVVGEKSLRLAGRCADGVILIENSGPAYVRWARSLMDGVRSDAGIPGAGQVIVYTNCFVSERDPDSAKSTMRDIVAEINGSTLLPTVAPASFAGEMKALIEEGGAEALRQHMPDSWLHELALTGSHEDASKSVARLAQAGADTVVLVPPEDVDWDNWLADQQWATSSSPT